MAIKFYLTDIGRNAVLEASNVPGFKVELFEIGVGTGKYNGAASQSKKSLVNEIARYPINGGSVDEQSHTLRFIANIESTVTADIFEIGLYTKTGVLFAIAATSSNNKLLHLSLDIVSILTFGLVLTDIELSKVIVNIDANSPIAIALMTQHLAHSNPHPQYAFLKDFENLRDDLLVWADQVDEQLENLQQQVNDSNESLQQQISNLASGLASLYPKNIMSGRVETKKAYVRIERPANSSISFLDNRYAIIVSPESLMITYRVLRFDTYFEIHCYASIVGGQLWVGNGIFNYSVIQTEGLTSTSGNGEYNHEGREIVFPILAGESKSFLLIGAGAGAGSSRYEDLTESTTAIQLMGEEGESTYLSIDGTSTIFRAGGGKPGVGGIDAGNGQYIDGTGGLGGIWTIEGEYSAANRTNGQAGNVTAENHTGAKTDTNGRGAGGDGADGYLTAGQGFGGGAGEGARLSVIYTNNTANTQYARLYVGRGGKGEQSLLPVVENNEAVTNETQESQDIINYVAGGDGANGYARVSSAT